MMPESGGGSGPNPMNTDLVAVVASTRPYSAIDLIPILVKQRITSIERGWGDALAFVQHLQPDFVIAVVDATRIEDLELVRNLSRASNALLMVLSPSHEALAASLRAGADVYARDSDGPEALEAQLLALRRRVLLAQRQDVDEVLESGPIRIQRASRKAWANGRELNLTNMELSLLTALVEERGRVLSALQAARMSTGRMIGESEAVQTIKVYVRRLRQKLEEAGCPAEVIVNVRGRGYMFDPSTLEDSLDQAAL
jgi:DNA-binding response OmpR family regulator